MNQGNRMTPLSINFYKETRKKLLNLIEEKITVGVVSVLCGVLPAAMGLPSSLAFIMGLAVLFCWVRFFGKKVE